MRISRKQRRAATVLEFAIIGPLAMLLIIGAMVGGLGVFRCQQVAMLAREGSRWASTHGADYALETGNAAASSTDVLNQAILPAAVGLDRSKLSHTVTWNSSNSPTHSATVNGKTVEVSNTVTVTVNYNWLPEAYLGGINFSSSSTSVMSY